MCLYQDDSGRASKRGLASHERKEVGVPAFELEVPRNVDQEDSIVNVDMVRFLMTGSPQDSVVVATLQIRVDD